MLTELKKAMLQQQEGDFPSEAILESTTSVKDAFLDNPEAALIGAETDPEIKDLISNIPGYESGDDETEMEVNIQALAEGMTETVLETHDMRSNETWEQYSARKHKELQEKLREKGEKIAAAHDKWAKEHPEDVAHNRKRNEENQDNYRKNYL